MLLTMALGLSAQPQFSQPQTDLPEFDEDFWR
jgi:hypothetical protein